MRRKQSGLFSLAMAAMACWIVVGCTSKKEEFKTLEQLDAEGQHEHDHDHGHMHGPNDGEVFDIGNHEFLGEFVIDHDTHELKLFLWDHDLKEPVEAVVGSVVLTLPGEGAEAKTYEFASASGTGESASALVVSDDELIHILLDDGEIEGTLTLKIGEKEYTVALDLPVHGEPHDHGTEPAAPAE